MRSVLALLVLAALAATAHARYNGSAILPYVRKYWQVWCGVGAALSLAYSRASLRAQLFFFPLLVFNGHADAQPLVRL